MIKQQSPLVLISSFYAFADPIQNGLSLVYQITLLVLD
jgi:hypothetical protein